jgi:hypothetical protein
VPEDSPVSDFFGWFVQGSKNEGMERMGAREEEDDESDSDGEDD